MSNTLEVVIQGSVPYDIVQKGDDNVKWHFAMFSSPCWGLGIKYLKEYYVPYPKTGGKTCMYDFEISGAEAMHWQALDRFVDSLRKIKGVVIIKAIGKDLENPQLGWSKLGQMEGGE